MRGQKDREEFIARLSEEREALGLSGPALLDLARKLLRAGATLHRLAELQCSSEAADRDRVKCPSDPNGSSPDLAVASCLCQDYGSFERFEADGEIREYHGTVPRIAVQGDRLQRRVEALCKAHHLTPIFGGDPRGAVLLVKVPSGRTNDWGGRGIFVA